VSTLFASLPRQLYCYVDARFLGTRTTFEPCSWFGLTSVPGRAWGLSVLLECGAMYSHVPPHAIYFAVPGGDRSAEPWKLEQAQLWDCFGVDFAVHVYDQLDGRDVKVRWPDWCKHTMALDAERCVVCGKTALQVAQGSELGGEYLFTAQHFGDGYSLQPEQAKQYHFVKLENGRLCTLPANCILFIDKAFVKPAWPDWLRRQEAVYSAEGP
jgi:hypothetical protein